MQLRMFRNDFWRTCPDFPEFVCTMTGLVERKDGEEFPLYLVSGGKGRYREYWSLREHWRGHVHRQIFRAWGPANPEPVRYTCIDHEDNNPMNNHIENLRWSCASLNALNVDEDQFRGWTYDKSRTRPYRAQIKWLGKVGPLGRFKTQEEARARYLECKAWLQVGYREHFWRDEALVWMFRLGKHAKNIKSSSSGPECERTLKQLNRIMANFDQFVAKLD